MTNLATNSQPGPSASSPLPVLAPGGPLALDQLLEAITAADAHFDAGMSEQYQQQPLARTWLRVTTGVSVAGKVIDALSAWTGENFRKGVCGTREDLLGKLADGVVALLCATQHVTKDQDMTWAVVSAAARKVCRRIAQQQTPGLQLAVPGLFPPDGSFTLAQLLEAVTVIDAHIDGGMSEQYQQQPLARTWARVTKGASEAAEAIDALSAWTGGNFREGVCGTREDLLGELADGVMALLAATQHVTKDQSVTWAAVSAATCRLLTRPGS